MLLTCGRSTRVVTQNGAHAVYVSHIRYATDARTLLLARCKRRKSRNTVGYREITQELQIQSRRSKKTVLRNSRRKDRYVARFRAMRGTCTRSTIAKCAIFRENRIPCISVLKREIFSKKWLWGPHAPLCNKTPLWVNGLTPISIDWKLIKDHDDHSINVSSMREVCSRRVQSG